MQPRRTSEIEPEPAMAIIIYRLSSGNYHFVCFFLLLFLDLFFLPSFSSESTYPSEMNSTKGAPMAKRENKNTKRIGNTYH